MILFALVTKLFWILLSTATEAEITVTFVPNSFVRTRRLTSSIGCIVTAVVVKPAHGHSVLCGLAFLSIYRNLCVTVAESSLGKNQAQVFLSAVFLVITWLSQEPDPPEAVLPLQAAAAAMWRDCHAKS